MANTVVSSSLDYYNSLLEVCLLICTGWSMCWTHSLGLSQNTQIMLLQLLLLRSHYNSIFQIAILVCKFLHTGNPKYFNSSLILWNNIYNNTMFPEIPRFIQGVFWCSFFQERSPKLCQALKVTCFINYELSCDADLDYPNSTWVMH